MTVISSYALSTALFSSSKKRSVISFSVLQMRLEPEIIIRLGDPEERYKANRNSVSASGFKHLLTGMMENQERSAAPGRHVYPAQEEEPRNQVCYDFGECVRSGNIPKKILCRQSVAGHEKD
jgi:hypothetical protein